MVEKLTLYVCTMVVYKGHMSSEVDKVSF